MIYLKWGTKLLNFFPLEKKRFTHGKIRDKCPLLNGLVVGGLSPHKAEVKGQTRVVRTHDH